MLAQDIDGPALVRLSPSVKIDNRRVVYPVGSVSEFYVVFWRGTLQPAQFDCFARAQKEWMRLNDLYGALPERQLEVA